MSSAVKRLPPYVLLTTRVGGEGDRAGGTRFDTSEDGEVVATS